MTASENKEIVRRLVEEVLGRGRVELIPALVAADHVGHLPIGDHYGPEGVRIDVAAYRIDRLAGTRLIESWVQVDDLASAVRAAT